MRRFTWEKIMVSKTKKTLAAASTDWLENIIHPLANNN